MEQVDVHDATTRLSSLLDRAHAGEEIILAKAGKPYARLVPLRSQEARVPGRYKDEIPDSFFDELPAEELEVWEK
jgi:prevent-host-death family protein